MRGLLKTLLEKEKKAGNQHFLLFPQCFLLDSKQISCFQPHLFCRLQMLWIWTSLLFSSLVKSLPIPTQWHLLTPLGNRPFEKTVGKGEFARNKEFLLFPQCFLPIWITGIFSFSHNVYYSIQNKFHVFSHIYFVVCKWFEFRPVYYFAVW